MHVGPGTLGAGGFLAALAWLHATQRTPTYVSQYALGDGAWVWAAGLLGLAVAGTSVGLQLKDQVERRRQLAGRLLVGVGLAVAWLTVWRADPGRLPVDTFVGRVHIYGAVTAFIVTWLASLLVARTGPRAARLWAGAMGLALVWLLVTFLQQADAVRWAQRSVVVSLAAWLVFLEQHLSAGGSAN